MVATRLILTSGLLLCAMTIKVLASPRLSYSLADRRRFRPLQLSAVGLPLKQIKEQDAPAQPFPSLKKAAAQPVADENPKMGSFRIDDGDVIGAGTYVINADGVDIDLKLKITPGAACNQPCSSKPTAAPGGEGTTAAPGGTTAAPGGITAAPGGTTAAPGGTTAAPGGTTAAPGGTTAAPGGTTGAPGATTPSGGGTEGSDVGKEGLELHNKFRKVHGVPEMKLNAEMSKSATAYAKTIADMGQLKHSSEEERANNGENLAYGCSSAKGQTATEAVTNWYDEVCKPGYTFGSESSGGTGHFTQVVWKESIELGFGKADSEKDGMKCTYYVGRYKVAGNMAGDFSKNVLKGSFDATTYCSSIKDKNGKRRDSVVGRYLPEKTFYKKTRFQTRSADIL